MTKIKFIMLLTGLLAGFLFLNSQNSEIPTSVLTAVESGNAEAISGHLGSNVELVIENNNDVYTKEQASGIITDFFRKRKVTNFQLLHKGNKDATSFAIVNMKTTNGNYRVYILTRKNQIQQLRIEPSNE